MPDVIINFQATQAGFPEVISELAATGRVEQQVADQVRNTNRALAEQQANFAGTASSVEELTDSMDSLQESIAGGGFTRLSRELSDLIKNLTSTASNVDTVKAALKLAKEQLTGFAAGSTEFIELSAAIQQAEGALAGLQEQAARREGVESLIKSLGVQGQGLKSLERNLVAAKTQLAGLSEGTEEFNNLTAAIQSAEAAAQEIRDLGLDASFEDIYGQARPLQTQLGEIEDRLYSLLDAARQTGEPLGEEFEALRDRAVEIRQAIIEVDSSIDGLAEKDVVLNGVIEGASGIASGFAAAEGAAALFGSESESLNKALVRINAAMAILQGLQQIQALLQKESALYISANLALQRIAVFQTNLQAAAESRNIIVRYAAIAAQRLLNTVMAANPAGVALIAIGALAAGLVYLTSRTDKITAAQKKANKQLEDYIASNERAAVVIQQMTDVELARLERNRASSEAIRKAETDALREQVNLAKKDYDRAIANADTYGKDIKKLNREQIENYKTALEIRQSTAQRYFDLETQLQVKRLQNQREAEDESLKSQSAYAAARVAQAEEGSAEELRRQIQLIQIQQKEQLQAESLTDGERAQILAENARQIEDLRVQIRAKGIQDQINLVEASALREKNTYLKLNKDIEAIILTAQRDLLNASATEAVLIEAKRDADILALRQQFFGDLTTLTRESNIRIDKEEREGIIKSAMLAQERLNIAQQESQRKIELSEQELEARRNAEIAYRDFILSSASSLLGSLNTLRKNETDVAIQELDRRLDANLITQEQYDQQVKRLQRQQAVREKQAAILQATLSLSQSILKVLSDKSIPVALQPVYIALNSAAALAQIAAIKSAPIPAFAEGTDNAPGGPSLVGEAGAELIYDKGRWFVASKPMVVDLNKGAKVIPNLETEKIFKSYNISMPTAAQGMYQPAANFEFNYSKLGRIISKQLEKLPISVTTFDRDGVSENIARLSNWKSHLNSKYRSTYK